MGSAGAAMDAKKGSTKILLLPWLAHGHISPFFELAKKLTKHHLHIYLCSSPVNLEGIRPKLSDQYSDSIQLVELHLPSLPDLPPHMHTTKGIPLHLQSTLIKAFEMAAPDFSTILHTLKPDLLISDLLQPWAAQSASSLNIPTINFIVTAASPLSCMIHAIRHSNQPIPFPELDLRGHWSNNDSKRTSPELGRECAMRVLKCLEQSSDVILVNSAPEIEGKLIDFLSSLLNKKVLPIAPLVPEVALGEEKSEIIDWLDKKKPKSTVYVSFGSEFYLSREDREELAHGLEQSGANFIWVIRFPKGEEMEKIEEALPEGFLERVGERGFVVNGWAPQLRILAHSSLGGFVCHCGWNSVVESVMFGVPLIALPMQLDQPVHTRVAEAAGVCVEAKRDAVGNVRREEVARGIREVVFEKRGEGLGERAREISATLRKKEGEIIDGLVAEIGNLCDAAATKV